MDVVSKRTFLYVAKQACLHSAASSQECQRRELEELLAAMVTLQNIPTQEVNERMETFELHSHSSLPSTPVLSEEQRRLLLEQVPSRVDDWILVPLVVEG